jgi:hypothetical protein
MAATGKATPGPKAATTVLNRPGSRQRSSGDSIDSRNGLAPSK